jgi:hypothetical protein
MPNRYGFDVGNNEKDNRFLDREYSLGNGVTMERDFEHGFHSGYPDRMTAGRPFDELKNHYGKGPRGYVRNPDRIHEDICLALTHHDEIDASNIDVIVKEGEVFLEGEVEGRDSKWLAEDIAESTLGVNRVINHLKIQKEQSPSGHYQLSQKAAREARDTDRS